MSGQRPVVTRKSREEETVEKCRYGGKHRKIFG
jgi:hypothetical protein